MILIFLELPPLIPASALAPSSHCLDPAIHCSGDLLDFDCRLVHFQPLLPPLFSPPLIQPINWADRADLALASKYSLDSGLVSNFFIWASKIFFASLKLLKAPCIGAAEAGVSKALISEVLALTSLET